ncbi:MAG TPA: VOC family protein [Casimicrobiaceae bacterium]|jgi:catechol 2,3-dioxygenase-like lactoylglutathione lyase family enzyme|nr:VOC family protein [Casimicrobiaceae bacterium]
MTASPHGTPRRHGVTAVHSINRFAFSVPDLDAAQRFYTEFGLDARRDGARVDLYAHGHPHRWASIYSAPGPKRLQYLSFGVYGDDLGPLLQRLERLGVARTPPHQFGEDAGAWFADPDGNVLQVVVAPKVTPEAPSAPAAPATHPPDRGAAPGRSSAARVRPRRLSHVLLFAADVPRSVRFYDEALGLRLSDRSGDVIAFMHGAHASDHHLVAFAKSAGPGLHHSSWVVASIDEIGLGMQHMADCGYVRSWGVGRHVIGSNYFCYVQDPWGSFAEYSHDIDFVPADVEWRAADHPLEDSFYVWGPPPPDYFIVNHEIAAPAE